MSEMSRVASVAGLTRRMARVAVAGAVVFIAACSGTDSVDPLGSSPSFARQATSLATPVASVTVNGSTVTVSWAAVANAVEYQVVVEGGLPSEKTTATSVVYANAPNGSYQAKVRALGTAANNESGFSAAFAFAVNVAVTPGDDTPAADATPPVITSSVVGTLGANGWYTSDVAVSWSVTDAESAISSSTNCTAFSITADQQATTYTCSATSAGGTSSSSVTVSRDATIPAIAFAGNAGAYTVDQFVGITCSASDVTSGIASSSCPGASGAAYQFNIGSNGLAASATDNAGNGNSASASFTVSVTTGSLCNLTQRFVSSAGIANSMCVKLNAAGAAIARGNMQAKAGPLGAYVKEVQAQTGKSVSAANAAILISLANQL
jgi:hypothetical protein